MAPILTESGPNNLHWITYQCQTCTTETQRIIKIDDERAVSKGQRG